MNLVDIFIIIVLVLAALHGLTQGAALQVLSFGGFWIGLLIGAWLAPVFSSVVHSSFQKAFVSLVAFLGLALIGGSVGRYIGTHAWGALRRLRLGSADSVLGAVVSIVAGLSAVWLIAILLAQGPTPNVARAVNRSAIVRALSEHLPAAPGVLSRLQRFINNTPFPQVFQGLEPIAAGPVHVPGGPIVQAAVNNAGPSTVRIQGFGCGGIQTGSGFVAAPGLVVTNAHVVAGIESLQVQDQNGDHRATPVYFDPELDVAVLRAADLFGPPLTLLRTDVAREQGGAILGFPGGGRFSAGPAAVLSEFTASGRDIYGQAETKRNVYQLQAQVKQGNSGGPFARGDGVVMGVVFAASTTNSNVGYALTSKDVAARLDQARNQTSAVGTGACAA